MSLIARAARRITGFVNRQVYGNPYEYLTNATGIIHVGANLGQERETYAQAGLRVVWIEPIPEVFAALSQNISGYADQIAVKALITERDGEDCVLHVANNDGQSSSIFDLHMHKDVWPDIHYVRDVTVRSETLPTALRRSGIQVKDYDALVLDTQGSELLVLKGAADILRSFKYIRTEAAEFEVYKNAATVAQVETFLKPLGFRIINRKFQIAHPEGGRSFDLLFKRR